MLNLLIKTTTPTNPLTDAARQKIAQEFASRLAQAGVHASSTPPYTIKPEFIESIFAAIGLLTVFFLLYQLFFKGLPRAVKEYNRMRLKTPALLIHPLLPSFLRMHSLKMARVIVNITFWGMGTCFTTGLILLILDFTIGRNSVLHWCSVINAFSIRVFTVCFIYFGTAFYVLWFRAYKNPVEMGKLRKYLSE